MLPSIVKALQSILVEASVVMSGVMLLLPGCETQGFYHCASARETLAIPANPSTRAAPVDKSMQRPFTNGPRSFIRTVTLRPVECEVTVT
jgi:hypothetical protein